MSVLDDRIRDVVRTIGEAAPNPPALRQDPIRSPLSGRRMGGPLVAVVSFVVVAGVFVGAGFLFGGQSQTPATNVTPPSTPDVIQPATTSPSRLTTQSPSEREIAALLNGFLEARIAGEGAEEYINSLYPEIPSEDIPLLYTTSSGARYERAEFEPVVGIDWPYGFRAYKLRLFAGDTVVEQLFFMPHDDPEFFPADGRLGLEYQPYGFATDIAPTIEDGQPLAVPYSALDGEVTLHAAHPWVFNGSFGRLIPEGTGVEPTTDGAQRNEWDSLVLMADPAPAEVEASCQTGPRPADAAALAESIRSYPFSGATAPVAVSVGGVEALMMDVRIAAGTIVCGPPTREGILDPVLDIDSPSYLGTDSLVTSVATGDWMRLYLFDVPDGSSARILAIAIIAPQSRFEKAVEAAAPVVDSIEFHAP